MDPAEYEHLYKLEDNLWWFVAMRRIVDSLLHAHLPKTSGLDILDAGCGTGGSLRQLQRYGRVTAFDFYPKAAQLSNGRSNGRIAVASIDAIPYEDASFDLVTSLDVICQLEPESEQQAIRELVRVLKPGGTLIVRCPALQILYGSHDETLQTRHRYTASEMAKKLRSAGLRPVRTTYANTLLLPIAFARRMLARLTRKRPGESDVRPVPAPLNLALETLLSLEAPLLKRASLPIGLSVIAVAKKP